MVFAWVVATAGARRCDGAAVHPDVSRSIKPGDPPDGDGAR